MPLKNNRIAIPLSALALAGCGLSTGAGEAASAHRIESVPPTPGEGAVKVGQPYEAGGQTYTPADQVNYDEVGYASWYGNELAGSRTGNGESFNPDAITGAHKTLPMPSYVEVTNLDTGRTILVRINDRGPFTKDRIIDLSKGAAQQLGVAGQGRFPARVRRVSPPEHERVALRNGEKAAERLETPPALLNALRKKLGTTPILVTNPAVVAADIAAQVATPTRPVAKPAAKPVAKPAPPTAKPVSANPAAPPADSYYYVQVGAFSSEANARTAAKQVGGSFQAAGKFWRVRTGPFASETLAKAALGPVVAKGYRDARITR